MRRLVASPDPALWIPVTGSFGLRGRRARKKAIGMLLSQAMRGVTPGAGLGEIDGAGAGPAHPGGPPAASPPGRSAKPPRC